MKLGKMEKLIIKYLWFYTISTYPYQNHGYRSQILFVLYNLKQGNYKFSYRRNIKKHIPSDEYNRLQVLVTRSTKSLETKGLIRRESLSQDFFKKRKYAFFLTETGFIKAKELIGDRKIKRVEDICFEDQGNRGV